MRSLVGLFTAVAAVAWFGVRQLPETEAAPEPARVAHAQQIESVALDARGIPTAALREVLETRAGDQLDAQKLDHDRSALVAALAGSGYLAAKVEPARVAFDASGAAFVTFAIAQGPVFHVRSVTVTGAAARDAGVVTIAQGDLALGERLARARDAVADRLAARGKHVTVAANLVPDEAAAAVDVELAVR